MGIDSEAEKDLGLTDEDAEGVTGGSSLKKKKPAKHTANVPRASAATGHVAPPVNQGEWGGPTETDPGFDPALGRNPDLDS